MGVGLLTQMGLVLRSYDIPSGTFVDIWDVVCTAERQAPLAERNTATNTDDRQQLQQWV
jgi:hypothetical protein